MTRLIANSSKELTPNANATIRMKSRICCISIGSDDCHNSMLAIIFLFSPVMRKHPGCRCSAIPHSIYLRSLRLRVGPAGFVSESRCRLAVNAIHDASSKIRSTLYK